VHFETTSESKNWPELLVQNLWDEQHGVVQKSDALLVTHPTVSKH